MYELEKAGVKTYYIDCPSKVGVYQTAESEVWLIDSGNSKDMARRINKCVTEQGWTIKGIVNTHSNPDHVGANATLAKRTGCKIIGAELENAFTRFPILEPSFLYGGYPMKALRNKFLLATASFPSGTVEQDLPPGMCFLPLPGHFFAMCGIRTDDDVVFIADSVFSAATIAKYHIFFIYDVAAFLETLQYLETLAARIFVPSHAEATTDIKPLVETNRQKVFEIVDAIISFCEEPVGFEEILKQIFTHYNLEMNLNQYVLVGSTIRSYLSFLCDSGRLSFVLQGNRLLFKTEA